MDRILHSIDPGTNASGYVKLDTTTYQILHMDKALPNAEILRMIRRGEFDDGFLVMEGFECHGKAVGYTTFIACEWAGRFREAWESRNERRTGRVFRNQEKVHLCNATSKVKQEHINQALKDVFIKKHGGHSKWSTKTVVGLKKSPGPLFGISSHAWDALSVAVTWLEKVRFELVEDCNTHDEFTKSQSSTVNSHV